MHIIKTHVRAAWHFLLTRYYSTNRLSKIIALSGRFSMDLCKTISEGNPTCKSLFGKPHSFQRLIWSTQLLIATKHMLLRLTWHHRWCKLWLLNGSFQTVFQMHCQTAGRKKKLVEIWGVWIYLSLLSFSACLCVKAWHLWHDFWGPALCACFLLVTSWATTPSPSPMQMIFGSSEGMWGYVGMECPGTWEKWEEHCVFWMPNANLTRSALTTIHCHQS